MSDETVRVPAALVEQLRNALDAPGMPGARHIVSTARALVDAATPAAPAGEPLCICGHNEAAHDICHFDHNQCLCGCRVFTPTAPSAPVGEPLCKCGHGREAHIGEHTNCRMQEVSPYVHICPCWKFTPAPLSSPRRTRDEGIESVCWCGHAHTNGPACPKYGCKCVLHAPFERLAGEDDRS